MPYIEISGVRVNFPYDPYPCQVNYMEKVIQSLQMGTNAILESPTGTGKTLCLLCACLAWLENKKAQIVNNRWTASVNENGFMEDVSEVKKNDISDYRLELTKKLDSAAGTWNGELGTPKIIYSSRTHSQLNQAMQEFKKTSYRYFKACVIGSREQLCIHPHIMKENNNVAKVHMCRAKVSNRTCHFYNQVETFKTQVTNQVLDIEDLVSLGQKNSACPYYLSRELKKDADIIFMPYNYLLDSKSRKAHGVELKGNILIFDEAHNLERICEESASFDLSSSDLASAISDVNRVIQKVQEWQSAEIVGSVDTDLSTPPDYNLEDVLIFKDCLLKLEGKIDSMEIKKIEDTYDGSVMYEILSEAGLTLKTKNVIQDLIEKMISTLTNEDTNAVFISKGGGLSKFSDVLKIVFSKEFSEKSTEESYIGNVSQHYKVFLKEDVIKNKKKSTEGWDSVSLAKPGRVLSYWCFNPGFTMADLVGREVRSILLTSGTLSPLQSFISEFGIEFPVTLENPHVIDQKQVWIGSVERSPDNKLLVSTYENRSKDEYMQSLGLTVVNFAKMIPKGLLVFFPSYPVMEKCLEFWQKNGITARLEEHKQLYVEPKNKLDFSNAMSGFYEKIKEPSEKGAVFVAVCRGKVSEGLDFADNNGRGVIITGLPFPPKMDPRVTLKMKFLDDSKKTSSIGLTGQDWYVQQASRAVNQAIGRVIRHRNDFGVILLCDHRFSRFKNQLPIWLRSIMEVHLNYGTACRKVAQFFKPYESQIGQISIKRQIISKEENTGCFEMINARKCSTVSTARASSVTNHYASRKIYEEDNDLALYEMYSGKSKDDDKATRASSSNGPKQPLLAALESTEKNSRSSSSQQSLSNPSDSTSPIRHKNIFSKSEKSKKIVIRNNRDIAPRPASEVLEFLEDVKKVYSKETYAKFRLVLATYKSNSNVVQLIHDLQEIFNINDPANLFVYIVMCTLLPTEDKEYFKKICQEVIGQEFTRGYDQACGNCVPSEPGPPSKKFKKSSSDDSQKMSGQTQMNDFFCKPKLTNSCSNVDSTKSSSSVHMDSKSHMQTSTHMSSVMKKGSSLLSSSGMKSLPPRASVSSEPKLEQSATTEATVVKNETNNQVSSAPDFGAWCQKRCPSCKIVHEGPLAQSSRCGHFCCKICWDSAIKNTKKCPICNEILRRKFIRLGYFLN